MAIREVEESELQQLYNIAGLYQSSLKNPRTRQATLRIVKELHPNASIPELDAADPIREEVAELRERMEQQERDRQARELQAEFAKKWQEGQRLVRDKGYTAEGLEQVEKFMQDNAIADHRIALPAFEALNPTAQPINPSGRSAWDFGAPGAAGEDKLLDSLVKGEIKPRQFVRGAAIQALQDLA